VLETNAPQIEVLAREKLLQKMNSPFIEQELLPEVMPAHGEWAPDRLNLLVYAYNTHLVKPADVPRSWQTCSTRNGSAVSAWSRPTWSGSRPWLNRWARNPASIYFGAWAITALRWRTGHNHSAVLVAAGEIPLMLGIYSHDAERMKAKPRRSAGSSFPPAVVLASAVAVSRRAPHPGAAALFYDYMLTDGQRFYTEVHRVPERTSATLHG